MHNQTNHTEGMYTRKRIFADICIHYSEDDEEKGGKNSTRLTELGTFVHHLLFFLSFFPPKAPLVLLLSSLSLSLSASKSLSLCRSSSRFLSLSASLFRSTLSNQVHPTFHSNAAAPTMNPNPLWK